MKFRIEPNTVAILLTDKCTAECEMCCFACSPQKSNVMDIGLLRQIIDQAAKMPNINTVGFSGGEVFLQYDILVEMVKYASKQGLRTTCTTNGFWGNTYDQALKKLLLLKENGLSKLGLSMDYYHQQYVNINNLKNILMASKKLGIPVDIGSVITKSTSDLSESLKVLKDYLINVPHFRAACLPIGNAKNINKTELYYDEDLLNRDKIQCFELTFFSIYINGDVYPCCSQAGMIPILRLGNIKSDSLETLLSKYRGNMYIRIIKKYGFSWFIKIAKKEGFERIYSRKYVNKCDLCNYILSDEDFLACVEKYIKEEQYKIYNKYITEKSLN